MKIRISITLLFLALVLCITPITESKKDMSLIREINLSIDDLNIQALLEANHINISDLRPADIADALDLSPCNLNDID